MTAIDAVQSEKHETLTRLAYRTAQFTRVSHKHFPKKEADLFKDKSKPKRQTLADQLASAKLITQMMKGR